MLSVAELNNYKQQYYALMRQIDQGKLVRMPDVGQSVYKCSEATGSTTRMRVDEIEINVIERNEDGSIKAIANLKDCALHIDDAQKILEAYQWKRKSI